MYMQKINLDKGLKLWGANNLNRTELIKRSRLMHKDNTFIACFTKNFVQLVLSSGVTLRVNTRDRDKKKTLKKIWYKFVQNAFKAGDMTLDDGLRDIILSQIQDGDVLVYVSSDSEGKPKLNTVPSHRVISPFSESEIKDIKTKKLIDLSDCYIEDGVVHREGEIIGYTFAPLTANKPFNFIPRTFGGSFSAILIKDPISMDNLVSRGEPLLAPAIDMMFNIGAHMEAETNNAKMRSKMLGTIDISPELATQYAQTDEKKKELLANIQKTIQQIESADGTSFTIAFPGTKVTLNQGIKGDVTSLNQMIKPLLVYVSGLFGVSLDILTHDLSDNSSAIGRQLYMVAFQDTQIRRNQLFSKIIDPFFELLAEYHKIDLSDVEWEINVKPYGTTKAREDIEANATAIESGQKTLAQVCAENGLDVEDVIAEQVETSKYRNSIDPDYSYALDLVSKYKEKPEAIKYILGEKGYTAEVIEKILAVG